jgi:hypothetical protein
VHYQDCVREDRLLASMQRALPTARTVHERSIEMKHLLEDVVQHEGGVEAAADARGRAALLGDARVRRQVAPLACQPPHVHAHHVPHLRMRPLREEKGAEGVEFWEVSGLCC